MPVVWTSKGQCVDGGHRNMAKIKVQIALAARLTRTSYFFSRG
jgi:hypothetical protein